MSWLLEETGKHTQLDGHVQPSNSQKMKKNQNNKEGPNSSCLFGALLWSGLVISVLFEAHLNIARQPYENSIELGLTWEK